MSGAPLSRAAKVTEAQKLRGEGWLLRQIADQMGVSPSAVSLWLKQPESPNEMTHLSKSEVIDAIRALDEQLGRPPTCRDDRRLVGQAQQRFGSWNAAIEAASLPVTAHGRRVRPPRVATRDRIPLTSHQGIKGWAKIDPEDYDVLSTKHWNLGTDGYAYGRDAGRQIAMHRFILGLGRGRTVQVDHINGDKLDNRRANLRVGTQDNNAENVHASCCGKSRFRGVVFHAQSRKWMARASRKGKTVYIGIYACELDAAEAAEVWRRENMPFAQPDPELAQVRRAVA